MAFSIPPNRRHCCTTITRDPVAQHRSGIQAARHIAPQRCPESFIGEQVIRHLFGQRGFANAAEALNRGGNGGGFAGF